MSVEAPQKNYGLITSVEQLEKFVNKLIKDKLIVSFDIETGYDGPAKESAALRPDDPASKIVGLSFTNSTDWARYVPLGHDLGNNLDNVECAKLFWRLFTTVDSLAYNAAFEKRFLRVFFLKYLSDDPLYGPQVIASNGYFHIEHDPMIEAFVGQQFSAYGLKFQTLSLFGHAQADLLSLFPGLPKNKAKQLRFNSLTLEPHVVAYACEDAVWALAVHHHYHPIITNDERSFIYATEMRLLPIVCEMEDCGVRYNWAEMEKAAVKAERFLEMYDAEIQADLSRLADKPILINLNSPTQLRAVLFDELGMKGAKLTDTGLESTGAVAMETLSKKYPVVRKILDYKEIKTLITRFLRKYVNEYQYALDGNSHPSMLQCNVITGRFAVSNPPYQQCPKEFPQELPNGEKVKVSHFYQLDSGETFYINFREYVVCPPDHYLLGFDYSQIELRVLAGEAQEPYLIKAFEDDLDIHAAAASMIFNVPVEEVDKKQRDKAKTTQFSLLYQMGVKSLADRLALTRADAQKLFDDYFRSFSSVATWIEHVTALAQKRGYSQSRFGRRHAIWAFQSTDQWVYSGGARLAVNAPIQGMAADMMKVAMVRQHDALAQAGLLDRVHLALNVHDALEYYVHSSVSPHELISTIYPAVIFPVAGYPKIVADWHVGSSWGTLEPVPVIDGIVDPTWEWVVPEPTVPLQAPVPPAAAPVGAEQAQPAPEAAPACPEDRRTVLVTVDKMPDKEMFLKFVALLKSRPGDNGIKLVTPDGIAELKITTSLSPKSQLTLSGVWPGAVISWSPESVRVEDLMEGLEL